MREIAYGFKNNKWIIILSAFFAACSFAGSVGRALSVYGFSMMTIYKGIVYSVIVFFISAVVMTIIVVFNEKNVHRSKYSFVKQFTLMFCAQVILSLPMIIAFFPGMVESDAYIQLMEYGGEMPWNAHFPPISTEIMGGGVQARKCFAWK